MQRYIHYCNNININLNQKILKTDGVSIKSQEIYMILLMKDYKRQTEKRKNMSKKCFKNKNNLEKFFNLHKKLFILSTQIILLLITLVLFLSAKISCPNFQIQQNSLENSIQEKCSLISNLQIIHDYKSSPNNSHLIIHYGQQYTVGILISISGWITLLIPQMLMQLKNLFNKVQELLCKLIGILKIKG